MPDIATDFRRFAETLGVDLWPHQIAAANDDAFVTVIAAARRTGKTTLLEILSIWTAMRTAGAVVVILSANQAASRRVTESIGQRLGANAMTRGAVIDDQATRIKLSNNSEILSLPASQRQVRGLGRNLALLILDEAGFIPDELWRAAWPVALDERKRGSRIILAGTPWGAGFFRDAHRSGTDGDPDYSSHHWTYKANPNLDAAFIERQRLKLAPAEAAAELDAEWSSAAGSLFSRELLEAQTADFEVPAMADLRPPAKGLLGFDHGVSFDHSALCAIYRLPDQLNPDAESVPRFVALPYSWPQATPLSQTVRDVAAIPATFHAITTETNGVGAMPSQEIGRLLREAGREPKLWNFHATTAARKTSGYGSALALLERGQLILPRDPQLLRQLAGLRFEVGERGFQKIGAEDAAVHDDVADALMLATAPHKQRGSDRIQTALLQLASDKAVPDVQLDPLDSDVIETGAGFRVYRRPALQSVAGLDFTLPAGVSSHPPAPPEDRFGAFVIKQKGTTR
jgi:hypothetical protein